MIDKEQLVREVLDFLANISQQQPAKASDSGALGFCDPPAGETPSLFVDDKAGQFYIVTDPDKDERGYFEKKGLKCIVRGISIGDKEYDGNISQEIRLEIEADEPRLLKKTLSTHFVKHLLFGLEKLGTDIKNPVTIEVHVPDGMKKKVSFCNVYNSNGQQMRVKIDKDTPYQPFLLVEAINKALE